MKLLYQQLTEHLLSALPRHYHANFYSWMASGKVINEGRQITENGIAVAQIESECVFWFEELPFRQINPIKLLALMQVWLNENDEYRSILDRYEMEFEITPLDDNTVDLEVNLTFREDITAEQTAGLGDLLIQGEAYQLNPVEIWYAKSFDLKAVKKRFKEKKNDTN